MKKVLDVLKTQLKDPLETVKITWHQSEISLENDIEDFKAILKCIRNKTIRFKSNDGCNDITAKNQLINCEDTRKDVPKKRGRPTKTSSVTSEPKGRSDSSESLSLNDSSASTSSTRSRRAAAQAADHKLAQVQNLNQLKTKMRRPTNFDEKQSRALSSPPSKCRRTRRNQSAGSNSPNAEAVINGEYEKNIVVDESLSVKCLNIECSVMMKKLSTPTIKSSTRHPYSRSSRSLDRASERKSKDLFNSSGPLCESNIKSSSGLPSNSDPTNKTDMKKTVKRDLDCRISSNEEEMKELMKENLPIAQSSPISLEQFDGEFKGFEDQSKNNKAERQAALMGGTFVVSVESEGEQDLLKLENQESSCEEMEATETNAVKSKTKILRKRNTHTVTNMEEKENVNRHNETHIIPKNSDESPHVRSRTKVLKKAVDHIEKNNQGDGKNDVDSECLSSPETKVRSRTKTIRKHNEQCIELKSDSETDIKSVRSRTKTINKNNNKMEIQSNSSDDESNNTRSRTKTIRKGTTNIDGTNNGLDSEYLIPDLKHNAPSNNMINKPSPAPAKGELVKKRIEDFEKMQNGTEDVEEDQAVGRVTRNAIKSKGTSSATETQSSKPARNILVARLQASATKQPLSSDRPRATPLGVNNRMTPASDPTLKPQANKWTNSVSRAAPVETNNVALIQKQATEEVERKRKEEEKLKRKIKEEEAKRKKEKVLKATAEETRRKRVEKIQKVAASREAKEKEKEQAAAKAEKEKEEKMRQIAIEKEKQKEEQLKKKLLMQQKTLEHEERRKLEEAARLAKLKEQEEEHKRQLAIKERELELQKQQKAELRLAEAEKLKQQQKLGKIAAVNNAKLKMQGFTPSDKTNVPQPSNCYEITPAREDRPLLPPKTENDYGIDDAHSGDSSDDESQPRKIIPLWAQPKNRERLLMANQYIPKTLWDRFMECDRCPDINLIFAGNPIKRRIRTSSAVWRTPPKYSRVAPK